MTTVEAIAKRTKQLMIEKNICQKELEIKSKYLIALWVKCFYENTNI